MQRINGPFLARDSRGRIYRELRGPKTDYWDPQSGLVYIVILDPVAHTLTQCEIAERTCMVLDYRARASVNPPEASLDNDYLYATRENLGNGVMEGLGVTGTRETIPAPTGGDGYPRPTELEFWYSPELEINLVATRKYSNGNSQVIRVIDISRSEPDPALFQVPGGFIVQDQRGPAKN
jgi:hypothetical protein